jgi:uncharacterized protein
LDKAEKFLLQNEALNSLMLGVIRRVAQFPERQKQKPFLSTVHDEKGLFLCATMTPPFKVILTTDRTDYAEALPLVAQILLDEDWTVPGTVGENRLVKDFAEVWKKASGKNYKIDLNERLFKLTEVSMPPVLADGSFRVAEEKDIPLVADWFTAFALEALPDEVPEDALVLATNRVQDGMITFWEANGQVVTMSGFGRPTDNGINIGPVYTPPELRGRGYASASVAFLSQYLLDKGYKYVTLFTDLANPTSNSIYQKVGYKPVCDFDMYVFEEG